MENRSEALAALSLDTADARPSAAVERNLVAAFRAQKQRRRMPYLAIAASVLLLVASAWLVRSPKPAAVERTEVATEFFTVPGADISEPLEEPILVRVTLPRTALVKFGLPINAERSAEFVEADVVLGHNGLARAIRFVQ